MPPRPAFRLRPGRPWDISSLPNLYHATLGPDALVDILFPLRHKHHADYLNYLHRLFEGRFWSLEWVLTVVVEAEADDEGDGRPGGEKSVVGFTWWKRPADEISFWETWFTGFAWLARLYRSYISLKNTLLPIRTIDTPAAHAFDRAFATAKGSIFTTDRRRNAWYLSTLGVHPSAQGRGLGALLMRDGLVRGPERRGKAAWLIGLRGTDVFYQRFGFVEVGRANVGELSAWDGGIVMFQE